MIDIVNISNLINFTNAWFLVLARLIIYQGMNADFFSKFYNYYLERLRLSNNFSTTTIYVFFHLISCFSLVFLISFKHCFFNNINYQIQYNYSICIYHEGDKMNKEKKSWNAKRLKNKRSSLRIFLLVNMNKFCIHNLLDSSKYNWHYVFFKSNWHIW